MNRCTKRKHFSTPELFARTVIFLSNSQQTLISNETKPQTQPGKCWSLVSCKGYLMWYRPWEGLSHRLGLSLDICPPTQL
ncbi:hypothetical protein NPIL_6861 [Nephila pilipes]|uniref:Uncharacterized protein n=1 Tax=Nephila pilipes TaxID=299642 RepID=A0A8X6KBG4_NEPPI|nr:hypothetical protein NPIL_6861 [Nephila pilipes]